MVNGIGMVLGIPQSFPFCPALGEKGAITGIGIRIPIIGFDGIFSLARCCHPVPLAQKIGLLSPHLMDSALFWNARIA